jgi:dihydrofolate reductase
MSKVFSAHAVSVDGYISGRDARDADADGGVGRGLGDAPMLFDWYFDGDTPSAVFGGFKLSEPSARVFDAVAGRGGAIVCGHETYVHSSHFKSGSPHPTAPLVVLSHGEVAELNERQTLAHTIEDAIAAARELAGDKDVGLMGGAVATAALAAGLVDEVILHQVPILLGAGRPFFGALPAHVRLALIEAIPAPGVTHLRYAVVR